MRLSFDFVPVDSYAFSGESSVVTMNHADSFLSSKDPYYSRRYSFYVTTEHVPPLTTVMGAIRFILLQMTGCLTAEKSVWETLIGSDSFSLEAPPENMGVIKSITPVMIRGKKNDQEVICIKAPMDQIQDGSQTAYQPMCINNYSAKKDLQSGFLVYGSKTVTWLPDEMLFKTYDQPSVYTDNDNDEDGRFHVQQRCRLRDTDLDRDVKNGLASPSFYVEAELKDDDRFEKVSFPFTGLISMGGRSSEFLCKVSKTENTLPSPSINAQTGDYRLALLSPAVVSKEALNNCCFAITQYKAFRSAITEYNDASVKLKLSSKRRFLAESGCVFAFKNEDERDAFEKALNEANKSLHVCGFGRYIKYGGNA